MKKVATITAISALVLALALAACAPASLEIDTAGDGVHVVASNGAEGSGTGNITIAEGQGMCVNHIVEKGSFHVTATDSSGNVVFDQDLTDNIANFVPVTGEIDLMISARNADGTIDVIAYDVEAQAQADASLGEALDQAGVDSDVVDTSPEK